ncbi:ZnF_C2HC [Nesidiocoris tenuis]|uniref:ZnF_C2HC n=1 Tax=Nesidiocoris tenuis TaxID=355587 RepID=A0ABN7B4Q4_9HEMI|nr:ZnF_C2HC [Nesidiocoris tenuis]
MDSNGSCLPVVEKLRGSENYRSWKFQMTNVLKHEALWVCIAGFSEDDRTPADQKARKEEKALSKINLSVDKCVYPHVESAETAKIAWERLQEAFDGVGLFTSLSLLRRLCTLRLDAFNSTEEYVNEAMSVSTKLQDIREPVPDKFLAAVVLQGLPDSYKPMIMALQNSVLSSHLTLSNRLSFKTNLGKVTTVMKISMRNVANRLCILRAFARKSIAPDVNNRHIGPANAVVPQKTKIVILLVERREKGSFSSRNKSEG